MKIEEGKFYKTGDGRKAGPISRVTDSPHGVWRANIAGEKCFRRWYHDGSYYGSYSGKNSALGLVAPWTAEDEVKRRKEAGESPFKVGDQIETPYGREARVTAYEIDGDYVHYRGGWAAGYRCKLIAEAGSNATFTDSISAPAPKQEEPKESELEELVRRANDGEAAFEEIKRRFPNDVQVRCENITGNNWDHVRVAHRCEYRIKPKTSFEPFDLVVQEAGFYSPQYRQVSLVNDGRDVVIGCSKFSEVWLRTGLAGLCREGVAQTDGMIPLVATRTGILYAGHEISWAEADKLLAALNKVKQ